MNKILLIIFIFFSAIYVKAQKADDIIGKYRMPNDLDIEIFKKGDKYYGKVIALNNWENGQTKDYKNPDESKRNEPLLGKVIITGLEFDREEKEWVNGTLYGPDKGMFLDFEINEIRPKEVEATASKFIIHKTLILKKL